MARVLICSNNESIGLKVLYCLRAAGFRVDVVSIARRNATRFSRYLRRFDAIAADGDVSGVPARLADWINREATRRQWVAILGDDIRSHGILHVLRDSLHIPTFAPSGPRLLEECHDKWSFYCKLRETGLRVPRSHLVEHPDSLTREDAERVGFPLLVKPLNAEASHGIREFNAFGALVEYLNSPGPYKNFPLMIQQFVQGHTIGLSLLATEGRIECHDVQLHAEDGSRLFYSDPEVVEVGRRIVGAFGYGGPGHIDFVRDDASGALYALEFNCRFWYSVTVSMWRGGNFPALAVKLARQERVPESPTALGAYFQPGTVIQKFKRPAALVKLDAANWKGFWQAVSDPIPHLMHKLF